MLLTSHAKDCTLIALYVRLLLNGEYLYLNAQKFMHRYEERSTFLVSCTFHTFKHTLKNIQTFLHVYTFYLHVDPVCLMAYPAKALINVLLTLATCLTFLYGWLKLALTLKLKLAVVVT